VYAALYINGGGGGGGVVVVIIIIIIIIACLCNERVIKMNTKNY